MASQFSRVCCILNPRAGVQRQVRSRIIGACEALGIEFAIEDTQYPGHATELADGAVKENFDLVVAVGGDGTINEVGRALVGKEMPMGVIPVGSGNAFARAMGLSFDPVRACDVFVKADIRRLDVGCVEQQVFFSTSGIGLDASVAHLYALRAGRRGFWPYVLLTMQALRTFRLTPVRVVLDAGKEIERCPFLVAVANTSQYGNGVTIAPDAVPDDGVLDVCVISHPGWLRLGWHGRRLFTGSIHHMPGVEMFRAKTVLVERQDVGWLQFDGEARRGPKCLEYKILPRAVQIALPKI